MRIGGAVFLLLITGPLVRAQDPVELVRRAIAQDQLSLARRKDYTWQASSVAHHYDSHGKIEATKQEAWESLVLDGMAYRKTTARDGRPLSENEQRAEQQRLDRLTQRLTTETAAERQHRLDEAEKQSRREWAFLSELPDLFHLRMDGETTIDGRPVWIVAGEPRPGAQPKSRDAKMLLKVHGRMWIDKATGQWAKVEAETTDTISWGVFLARLHPGAKLVFEQTQVDGETWLPKRLYMSGSGRVGLVKRLTEDDEIEWHNYRKFSVDSKIVSDQ